MSIVFTIYCDVQNVVLYVELFLMYPHKLADGLWKTVPTVLDFSEVVK